MSTTTDLTTLKINFLTQSQYNTAKAQGLIEDDEIYMTETSCLVSNKVGAIVAYAGSDEPQGWFKCDGRAVSRTDYAELFATIGTTYGSGDGSTTFNIPNLENRVIVGAGDDYNLNDKGGASTVTLDLTQIPSHVGHLHENDSVYAPATSEDTYFMPNTNVSKYSNNRNFVIRNANEVAIRSTSRGGSQAHENMPPYIAINFLICYENSVISGSGGGGPVDSTDEPTATKIAEFDSNAHMNSTDMTTQALETYIDSLDIQGSVFVDATDVPIAGEIAKFDSTANMSSTDMTTGSGSELEDFIDGLNVSGGSPVETITPIVTATTGSLASATITKCGHVAVLALNVYNTSSVASGGNIFEGIIQNEYKPLSASGGGVGYYGANAFIGYVRANGTVTIRNASPSAFSSTTSSSPLTVMFTYIL